MSRLLMDHEPRSGSINSMVMELMAEALHNIQNGRYEVRSIQDYHASIED